jgi:hypothetical protein
VILKLPSVVTVVTGIVISISKQEYMFRYNGAVCRCQSFLELMVWDQLDFKDDTPTMVSPWGMYLLFFTILLLFIPPFLN